MGYELECKISIPDRDALVAALTRLGAVDHGDKHEENWVFDTPDEKLKAANQLLRLRRCDQKILTFKGPAPASKFKNREEIEVQIDSIESLITIFGKLGFVQGWFYEKLRHSFNYRDCEIMLDRLPELGDFIEVEGSSEAAIIAVLGDLNLDHNQHLEKSYRSLYREYCQQHGEGLPKDKLKEMRF